MVANNVVALSDIEEATPSTDNKIEYSRANLSEDELKDIANNNMLNDNVINIFQVMTKKISLHKRSSRYPSWCAIPV